MTWLDPRLACAFALSGCLAGSAQAQVPAGIVDPVKAAPSAFAPRPGQPPGLTPEQREALAQLPGYLSADAVPDSFRILPPAPGDSPTRQADVAAYRETRALQGGARWRLAASDAILTPFSILDDESCALGVRLDQTNAPRLVALLTRVGRDAGLIVNSAKDRFRQVRPFLVLGGPICTEALRAETAKSFAYPSGHATYSWAAGLILAELAPDRATAILARARAYGESRVVCGVHWVSDVEAGRTNASILVAVLHAEPRFQADLAAARGEIASARSGQAPAAGPPAGPIQCGEDAAAHTPWTR